MCHVKIKIMQAINIPTADTALNQSGFDSPVDLLA